MGGKSKKKVTVGFRFFWDLLMGLGRGPVNEIVEIRVDDKQAWAGSPGEGSTSKSVYIRKQRLFGGDDVGGEGGVDGVLEFAMGEPDQIPSNNVKSLVRGIVPGFRGVVTVFYSGYISAFSSYPKKWSLRVRRSTKGWFGGVAWYPEKAMIQLRNDNAAVSVIKNDNFSTSWGSILPTPPEYSVDVPAVTENLKQIHAMNPAHILVEAATNADWGLGLPMSLLDLNAYEAVADTLYEEGFGLCLRYNRQSDVGTFIQQILDHIGGAQFLNTEVGKLQIKLIRNDYDPDTLPVFNYDNGIKNVQDDNGTSSDGAINYLTVEYRDPVTNKNCDVTYQNLASIHTHGTIAETRQYLGLPTFDLAARVAQRDIAMTASGLTRLVLRCDRRAGILTPASCFRLHLPDRKIDNMVMRVGDMKEDARTGEWIVTAVQDLFGLPSTNYAAEQPPIEWIPADRTPYPVNVTRLIETPYFILAGLLSDAEMQYLPDDASYLGVLPVAPTTLSLNYDLQTRTDGTEFKTQLTGDWAHKAMLVNAVERHESSFIIDGEVPAELPVAVLIDNEIINITEINFQTGEVKAARGCADTLPEPHAANSIIWYLNTAESDMQQYIAGETVYARLLTKTSLGQLEEDEATVTDIEMNQRQFRPYPPGNLKINNIQWLCEPIEGTESFTLTWAHRDRILQADTLFGHDVGDIGPEPGTTYQIVLMKEGAEESIFNTDLTEYLYVKGTKPAKSFDEIQLYSVRDGLRSTGYRIPIMWTIPEIVFIFDENNYTSPNPKEIDFKFKE